MIVLPFPLTVEEMRVLQEFRRMGSEALSVDAIRAIRHPRGGGDAPARTLAEKGYLTVEADNRFALTDRARAFLAIDYKPEVESASDAEEEPAV